MDQLVLLRNVRNADDTSDAQANRMTITCNYITQMVATMTLGDLQTFLLSFEDEVLLWSQKCRVIIGDFQERPNCMEARRVATFWVNQLDKVIGVKGFLDSLFNRLFLGQYQLQLMLAPYPTDNDTEDEDD